MQVILSVSDGLEFEEAPKAKPCQAIGSFRQLVPTICDWWLWLAHDLAQWGASWALTSAEQCRVLLGLHHDKNSHHPPSYFQYVDVFLNAEKHLDIAALDPLCRDS